MDISKLKQKLEKLHDDTLLTKEVVIGDLKFLLKPLTTSQEMEIHDAVSEMKGLNYLLKLKQETLARSVWKIDGEEIPALVEENGTKYTREIFLKRFIATLAQGTIDTIFSAYLVLQAELSDKMAKVVTFENSEMIQKMIEEQNNAEVAKTIDTLIADGEKQLEE